MEAPPPAPAGNACPTPTTSYLFGVCSNAGTVPTASRCVGGKPAPCRTEGREEPGAKGPLGVKTVPPGRAGRAHALCLPSCSHAPLVDVSFFVTLQQDGSEGPKSLFSISMTVVLRLLEAPHYSRF